MDTNANTSTRRRTIPYKGLKAPNLDRMNRLLKRAESKAGRTLHTSEIGAILWPRLFNALKSQACASQGETGAFLRDAIYHRSTGGAVFGAEVFTHAGVPAEEWIRGAMRGARREILLDYDKPRMTPSDAIKWAAARTGDPAKQVERLAWLRDSGMAVPRDIATLNQAILTLRRIMPKRCATVTENLSDEEERETVSV